MPLPPQELHAVEVIVEVAMPELETRVSEEAWEQDIRNAVATAIYADKTLPIRDVRLMTCENCRGRAGVWWWLSYWKQWESPPCWRCRTTGRPSEMMKNSRKMSEIMKEMMERLLRDPQAIPSTEAAHVALFFANVAWNECVGLAHSREDYRNVWENIEAENPALWNELKSNDINAMIDELIKYKKRHFPKDQRRILVCGGTPEGTIHVEWLQPAAPGVDAKWETQLYGMVRTGEEEEATRFLQKTRKLSKAQALIQIAAIRMRLGMR